MKQPYCPQEGIRVDRQDAKYCPDCGTSLVQPSTIKSRLLYALAVATVGVGAAVGILKYEKDRSMRDLHGHLTDAFLSETSNQPPTSGNLHIDEYANSFDNDGRAPPQKAHTQSIVTALKTKPVRDVTVTQGL